MSARLGQFLKRGYRRRPLPGESTRAAIYWAGVTFVTITLLSIWGYELIAHTPDFLVRSGVLRDLIEELPQGRQSLVATVWLMPLVTLAALPFALIAGSGGCGLAHVYGFAAIAALGVIPAAALLRGRQLPNPAPLTALTMTIVAALSLLRGGTDLTACAIMIVAAIALERHEHRLIRPLSGTFWGLAMLAHLTGVVATALRLVLIALQRVWKGTTEQRVAANWVCGAQILYFTGVYVFLSWAIMGCPAYPCIAALGTRPGHVTDVAVDDLTDELRTEFGGCAPVFSGPWGYLAAPLLAEFSGHHFIDFHPAKLPEWEERDIVLVLPTRANPLHRLADIAPAAIRRRRFLRESLLLKATPRWQFLLVPRGTT